MDNRAKQWYAQIQISGVATPISFPEPMSQLEIAREYLIVLMKATPRINGNRKSITLFTSDKPFDSESKDKRLLEKAIAEGNAGLDESLIEHIRGKNPGETHAEYLAYMIATGETPGNAKWFADEEFGTHDPRQIAWLKDPKALRFQRLHSITAAYKSASPEEYAILKQYVIDNYPDQVKDLVFRTA